MDNAPLISHEVGGALFCVYTHPMGEHLFRIVELHRGFPDTRVLLCVKCGWSCEPMAQLEDLNPPECDEHEK